VVGGLELYIILSNKLYFKEACLLSSKVFNLYIFFLGNIKSCIDLDNGQVFKIKCANDRIIYIHKELQSQQPLTFLRQ